MYKKIAIENFKGIKNFSLEDFKQVNLIYGKNNTFKTTILEVLYILSSPSRSDNLLRINAKRGLMSTNDDIWKAFFYKNDTSKAIKFFGELEDKEKRELEITLKKIPNQKEGIESINTRTIQLKNNDKEPIVMNSTIKKIDGHIEFINSKHSITEIPSILTSYYNGPENIFNEIYANLSLIIMKKKLSYIISALKNIEPNLVNISLIPPKHIYIDTGFDTLHPLNYSGLSFIHALHLTSSLFAFTDGILLIDAIEGHFNSSYLELLYLVILKVSKELNIKVFITTNTLDSLKSFISTCIKNTSPKNNDIKVYCLEKNIKDNSLKYFDYDRNKFDILLSKNITNLS
jgi:AAA15 family ATPase/GTPase